jgi:hypothetical protein
MKHILVLVILGCYTHAVAQTISGQVYWPNGGIVDIPLTLQIEFDGCPQLDYEVSITNGSYNVQVIDPLICQYDSVRISMSGEVDARVGVSTLDLVKIHKYLLGLAPFTNVLQQIAADANNSESISALDLIEIRKIILGEYQEWPKNETLHFLVKTTPAPPPLNTYLYSEKALPDSGVWIVDFWVVKTGDIPR